MDCAKIKSKKGQMKSTTVCNLCMRRHFPMPHDDRTSALPLFFFFTGLWIRVHLLALPECHFCMQHFFLCSLHYQSKPITKSSLPFVPHVSMQTSFSPAVFLHTCLFK